MIDFLRSAAFAASKTLANQGLKLKRSHISEIIAALLGYRTYAALVVEEADLDLDYHIGDAEVLVLNYPMGLSRAEELDQTSLSVREVIISVCVEALKASVTHTKVFVGIPDFYDSYACEILANAIFNSDDVAGSMADCNAEFNRFPDMDSECLPVVDLWGAVDVWVIEADGIMEGEYDIDRDRMFNGSTLNCRGTLSFSKAGRAGLILNDADGWGGVDDSWRERDREDEMAYYESLRD